MFPTFEEFTDCPFPVITFTHLTRLIDIVRVTISVGMCRSRLTVHPFVGSKRENFKLLINEKKKNYNTLLYLHMH